MGLGCILIRLTAFDALQAPYFRCPPVESLDAPEFAGMDMDGIVVGDTIDDSIWFSKVMRRAGHKLWVDTALTLDVGHTGYTTHYVPRKG